MRCAGFLAQVLLTAALMMALAPAAAARDDYVGALVLDLNGTGDVELVPLKNSGVMWDVDDDDFRERMAWVAAGDGFLAVDWNENGEYDDHSEFFVDFDALIRLDDNCDGRIDEYDAIWRHLSVWADSNSNGFTERGEFQTAAYLRITSIGLSAQTLDRVAGGNIVSRQAMFVRENEAGVPQSFPIQNVRFAYDNVDSIYAGDSPDNGVVFFMPDARGYGAMPSLRIAMKMDSDGEGNLLDLVRAFSERSLEELFPADDSVMGDVAAIMYRWARVDKADPGGRGASLRDGRMLEYLEQMMDKEFRQVGAQGQANPKPGAASDLHGAFTTAQVHFYARLAAQGAGGALFTGDWSYDPESDYFAGVDGLHPDVLQDFSARAASLPGTKQREMFWRNVLSMIEFSIKIKSLPPYDLVLLDRAITASDSKLSLEELRYRMLPTYMVMGNFAKSQLRTNYIIE